jgi:hypothetical protein
MVDKLEIVLCKTETKKQKAVRCTFLLFAIRILTNDVFISTKKLYFGFAEVFDFLISPFQG